MITAKGRAAVTYLWWQEKMCQGEERCGHSHEDTNELHLYSFTDLQFFFSKMPTAQKHQKIKGVICVNHLPQCIAQYMEFPCFAHTLNSGKETEANPNVFLCLVVTPNENQSLFHWHILTSKGVLTYEALLVPTAVHLTALHLENLMSYLIFFSFFPPVRLSTPTF